MQVVHRERERLLGGQVHGQPVEAVECGVRGLSPRREGVRVETLEEWRGEPRRPRHHLIALDRVESRQLGLEELAHEAERELALVQSALPMSLEHDEPDQSSPPERALAMPDV